MKGIFVWRVQPGQEEEFERRWRLGSERYQKHSGAQGTRLHRGLTDRSLYVGYASWESLEHRHAAQQILQEENLRGEGSPSTDEVSEVVFAGFFDNPHDEVLSESKVQS